MTDTPDAPDARTESADSRVQRRTMIAALGAGLGALGAAAVARPQGAGAAEAQPLTAAACVLTPQATEGPYYVDDSAVRSDIREDRQGIAVTLELVIVHATTCVPIQNAAVDIWHCDALGRYSGVASPSDTTRFLRGTQFTDAAGTAAFVTIYPGWYAGRAIHIHVKVHVGGDEVHTGQLYFAETLNAAVAARTPYATNTTRRLRNDEDGIYRSSGGARTTLTATRSGSGYAASITAGVLPGASRS